MKHTMSLFIGLILCSIQSAQSYRFNGDWSGKITIPESVQENQAKPGFAKQYFSVCGKCSWTSPRTTTYSDASSLGHRHYMAQDGTDHKYSTVSYSSESSDHHISVCGKCNWSSPVVDSYSDGSSMGHQHYMAQEGTDHRCTTVRQ
ncbi:MAG: hypothetical protein ABWZ25_17035 [Chitinophagaceae bacterium]